MNWNLTEEQIEQFYEARFGKKDADERRALGEAFRKYIRQRVKSCQLLELYMSIKDIEYNGPVNEEWEKAPFEFALIYKREPKGRLTGIRFNNPDMEGPPILKFPKDMFLQCVGSINPPPKPSE